MKNSSSPHDATAKKIALHQRFSCPQTQSLPLNNRYSELPATEVLLNAIRHEFRGRIALVSSFGAESVVLLHMIAQVDRDTPVLFNETGMLFPETMTYQTEVADALGLTNVQVIHPKPSDLLTSDAGGTLHQRDTDACCTLRKIEPLNRALKPYSAWITGRKRHQSSSRAEMPVAECDDNNRVKLNPLAEWKPKDLSAYMKRHDLPAHPLISKGYRSIGCAPCTSPVHDGEDSRAGRWRGQKKTECGIHFVNGKPTPLLRQ